jgi:phosphohistidine swiveling domain-containing protein
VPLKETPLGTFFGDESFPVEWASETEKDLFWVFDDLHCPQPLSPMYEDIGGWWLTCDHMFRRFGTPFASDWIAKNVNGYLYTAAVPAEAGVQAPMQEYGFGLNAVVPQDPAYAASIGGYLFGTLGVYGEEFADWWRNRLVPEMQRNFDYLEAQLARKDAMSLAQAAVLLEDAIDIHDRHWKIHWMLNFAQFSGTLDLQATAAKYGKADPTLLGRLQNSATDRNWDKIEALWVMKEEVSVNPDLKAAFEAREPADIVKALEASPRGQRFIAERIKPYQQEFGWHAVWSHEFIFPSFLETMEPIVGLVRDQVTQDYDYPASKKRIADDIKAAAAEILDGLEGDALADMQRSLTVNLRMAPLTPDHHFYIDQGANAHVRQVLLAVGEKLVASGAIDRPDDVILMRYNELRYAIGNPTADARGIVAAARARREAAYTIKPRDWVGTCTETQLNFPYLNLWAFPEKFYRSIGAVEGELTGILGSPGTVEGIARVVLSEAEFDQVKPGDILVCQMTNPAWQILFGKIEGLVTDAGGFAAHPAVLAREYEIPAVVGTSHATGKIRTGDRIKLTSRQQQREDGTSVTIGVVEILERAG